MAKHTIPGVPRRLALVVIVFALAVGAVVFAAGCWHLVISQYMTGLRELRLAAGCLAPALVGLRYYTARYGWSWRWR